MPQRNPEDDMTAEELWAFRNVKYDKPDPISGMLVNNFYSELGRLVKKTKCHDAVEIGCGSGESSKRIYEMLGRKRKLEISEYDERLIPGLKNLKLPFKITRESVYKLKRRANSHDIVFLLEVLEHLEDVDLALKECFRVAKKFVIVSVPNEPLWRIMNVLRGKYWADKGNTPGHVNHWSPNAFRKVLSKYGDVVELVTPLPWSIALCSKRRDS